MVHKPDAFPYGAYLLHKYTSFDAATRTATIHYLMSTGNPYQVQLMRTTLRHLDHAGAPFAGRDVNEGERAMPLLAQFGRNSGAVRKRGQVRQALACGQLFRTGSAP